MTFFYSICFLIFALMYYLLVIYCYLLAIRIIKKEINKLELMLISKRGSYDR